MSKVRRRAGSAMASTSAIFLLFAVSQSISAADNLIGIGNKEPELQHLAVI